MKTRLNYFVFKSTNRIGDSTVEFQAFSSSELNEAFTLQELADLSSGKVVTRVYSRSHWIVQTKIATVEAAAKALGM
jgi:hypothetical protein